MPKETYPQLDPELLESKRINVWWGVKTLADRLTIKGHEANMLFYHVGIDLNGNRTDGTIKPKLPETATGEQP